MTFNKLLLFTFLMVLAVANSCQKKAIPKGNNTQMGEIKNTSNEVINVSNPELPKNEVESPPDAPIIFLKKTPCFGKCPVFEVRVSKEGIAQWKGVKNVSRLGNYTAVVSSTLLGEIFKEAEKVSFFKFAAAYPENGKKIADFPLTITTINANGKQNSIEDNFDAPIGLQNFEQYLFEKLDKLDWKSN
jgi:hypothetical protein